ncbi:MAG: metallophosphoesterase [Elusimicrobia bacterium]|nr:metallophosphoesterase [Elusimicrobiota bacterium]MDE2313824.1 metallophosphoesterase [Elusimicrobiota bacterium]
MNKAGVRTIIFGDVHGCLDELQDLLRAVRAGSQDRLISVGDLIGKGPHSRGVLDWAMGTPNLRCVLGNHERRFLARKRGAELPDGKVLDAATWRQLRGRRESYRRFISSWPLWIRENGYLVLHAGFDPRKPLLRQSAWDLITLRRLARTGEPWYARYRGGRLAVFGHWSRREPVLRQNAVGLDTGCVYGGRLTALVLPERRLVSVPARKIYRRKDSWL